MKLILIFVLYFSNCILIIDSRKHRALINDEFYPYLIDQSIPSFSEYFSMEHAIIEQVDDENVRIEGYGECIKSMVSNLPLSASLRTQYLEKSSWIEGPIRLFVPNICNEFQDPTHFMYNISKLWTACPPRAKDKWLVVPQLINVVFEIPQSFSKGPWRGYIIFSQGLAGSVHRFGIMLQMELIEIV